MQQIKPDWFHPAGFFIAMTAQSKNKRRKSKPHHKTNPTGRTTNQGKRAEEALRESEARFRTLAEAAPIGIFLTNPTGECIYTNPLWAAISGLSSEESLGYGWMRGMHPDDRGKVKESWGAAAGRGEKYATDYRVITPAGDFHWVHALATPQVDASGKVVSYVGTVEDITQRKQAEQEIERNLEKIRALHEINLAATSTLDLQDILHRLLEKTNILLAYSAAAVRLYNSSTAELEPVACRNLDEEEWKAAVHKGSLGLSSAVFESKAPLMVNNLQTDPRVRDPSFFIKQSLASCLAVPMTVRGEILGVLGFYTKEEHAFSKEEFAFLSTLAGQAAIAIQNSQLYEQTKKQAIELEKAYKGKTEFLNIMSHELRTPLNVIIGFTEMMKDRLLGDLTQKQEEALEKVTGQSRDLLQMINGVLQASSIEAGVARVKSDEISLYRFLEELRSSYDLGLNKEVTLHWHYRPELPVIKTDTEKLRHILQNLINNAIKFTQTGTVTLSAQIAHDAAQDPQGAVEIEFKVTDTGIGIPSDQLPIIFEMFRQVDSSDTRRFGGVGLGLYIVKQFTELLGGTVEAESEAGRGSTFTVRIPA
jgi:PAS domain S-box-containing protein